MDIPTNGYIINITKINDVNLHDIKQNINQK